MIVERLVQRQTSNEGLAVLKRPTGRRMGKQLLRIAGYATGWIVSGKARDPPGTTRLDLSTLRGQSLTTCP
jgi:hypothetical protein